MSCDASHIKCDLPSSFRRWHKHGVLIKCARKECLRMYRAEYSYEFWSWEHVGNLNPKS